MNFLKLVVIMKLKIYTTVQNFAQVCLKAIRYTFFQYVVSNHGRDGVRHVFPVLPLVASPGPP